MNNKTASGRNALAKAAARSPTKFQPGKPAANLRLTGVAKLTRPRSLRTVARERLFAALDRCREHRVAWVWGPPGAGKTTLVSSYLEQRKLPGIWYQVDAGDADPASFFFYLREASRAQSRSRRQPLPLFTPEYLSDLPGFTRRFFRALSERMPRPAVLVLDNFQEAPEACALNALVRDAAEELAEGVTLVVISRGEPRAEFARLRANQALVMLGWQELRLTLDESVQIVALRTQPPPCSARQAHERSGGWAAGLTLLLEQPAEPLNTTAAVPLDTQQALFDYFATEIFDRTPTETQRLWLRTAHLPQFTSAMACELSGNSKARALLDGLARRHYFTDCRATAEVHYQYHALFREFLLQQLERSYSADERLQLQHRSAKALEQDGDVGAALGLYQRAGDWHAAVQLVLAQAQTLVAQGRWQTLQDWLLNLPQQVVEQTPWVEFWIGACQCQTNPTAGRAVVEKAYARFVVEADFVGQVLSACSVIEGICIEWHDFAPLPRWIDVLAELIAIQPVFPSPAIELRVWASLLVALTHCPSHLRLADIATERVWHLCRSDISAGERLMAASNLVYFLEFCSDAVRAMAAVGEFDGLAARPETTPLQRLSWYSSKGMCCQMSFQLSDWRQANRTAHQIAVEHDFHFTLALTQLLCIYPDLAEGRLEQASTALQNAEGLLGNARPVETVLYHLLKAWLALQQEQPSAALIHAEQAVIMIRRIGGAPQLTAVLCVYTQALAENGQLAQAQAIAQELSVLARKSGDNSPIRFCALINEADIRQRMGNQEGLREILHEAMTLGRRVGLLNNSNWLPKVMSRLSAAALDAGIEADYVTRLIRVRQLTPPSLNTDRWPWPIKLHTLGRFAMTIDGQALKSDGKAQKKPLNLLKTVIAMGGRQVSINALTDILWPDPDTDAANLFRNTLHRLRKMLGREDAVVTHDGKITLNNQVVWVDLWAFERLVSREPEPHDHHALRRYFETDAPKVLNLYRGRFLTQDDEQLALRPARERLHSKFLRHLTALGQHYETSQAWEQALTLYRHGVEQDNVAEALYRGLMRCHLQQGNHADALSVYRRCREMLSILLGAKPSAETQALHERSRDQMAPVLQNQTNIKHR